MELDYILNIVEKFNTHPSIVKIKENVNIEELFYLKPVDEEIINDKIGSLNKRKPTTYKNIPTKIIVPKVCDLVLFPSSLFHKTIPFKSKDERMVIAFDIQKLF